MTVGGIAAFVTGLISLLKFKDRSFLVVSAVVLGSLFLLMIVIKVAGAIIYGGLVQIHR